ASRGRRVPPDLDRTGAVGAGREEETEGVVLRDLQLRRRELEEPALGKEVLEEREQALALERLGAKRHGERDGHGVPPREPGRVVREPRAALDLLDQAGALPVDADDTAAPHRGSTPS